MSAAYYRIAAVIKRSSDDKFLLVCQASPPALQEDHHRLYLDSHLWDLPSAPLNFLEEGDRVSDLIIQQDDSLHEKFDFGKFDVDSALGQVASQIGRVPAICGSWSVFKYVEEPDFGPDSPVKTLFILGHLVQEDEEFQGLNAHATFFYLVSNVHNYVAVVLFCKAPFICAVFIGRKVSQSGPALRRISPTEGGNLFSRML
ncbi:hypothetical protein KSP40_PGU021025 [Platanthera guangdongensis]|uniref:Uncharacterized protein n=1 Tax=Platanthera guangdongensis TaxID=2320717 RepID=A0ABR2LDG1_9ASPA